MAKKTISAGPVHSVPADLRKALISDPAARAKWEDITPLARNEWICWTISVKKPATRRQHVERVVSELKEGMSRPVAGSAALTACEPYWRFSMLVRRGKGILIPVIAFGCLVLTELATRVIFTDKQYYQHHGWPKLAGFSLAAMVVYALRPWFGLGRSGLFLDKQTGQEVRISGEDSFLDIPARFWPLILLGLGVVFFFVRG